MAWYQLDTQNINISNQLLFSTLPGNDGEVVTNNSGAPHWKKITGISRFLDNTDMVQDLNGSPIPIQFNIEDINNANIAYGVDTFTFNDTGFYEISIQLLLSNGKAQTGISFSINGGIVYTQLSTKFDFGYALPFFATISRFINAGDTLQIIGEKYIDEPNYLLVDPIYHNPVTQLTITKV